MKILFLTLLEFESLNQSNIYTDLLRTFVNHGHEIYAISPTERRTGGKTHVVRENGAIILRLRTLNIQKTNIIEKSISTLTIQMQFKTAVKKYFSDIKFDLILYSTPPITLVKVVKFVKKRDDAKTYLMLKDIFPQNAVDINIMKKNGIGGLIYKYFRKREKELYAISDQIGCMSQANVEYIIRHNPEISHEKVELCPNSIEIKNLSFSQIERNRMRMKYALPLDKKIFVYGGNLGKPQDIPFLIECLKSQLKNQNVYFLIVGSGTEYGKLKIFFDEMMPENMRLMSSIPKEDYDQMIAACNVGMIFLDHRFTIPNFPSRLLSYMQAGLPVLACTDKHTDIGKIITEGKFGWWCESDNVKNFSNIVTEIELANLESMGKKALQYLQHNFEVNCTCNIILHHFRGQV